MFKQIDAELYQFLVYNDNDTNIFFKLHFLNKGFNKNNIVYDWLRKIILEKITKIEEGINILGYKYIQYLVNDKKHNENGPAVIWYYESPRGVNKREEEWYINGKKHNEKGPAVIWYNGSGNKLGEIWYINGKKHNEKGPAHISYGKSGNKEGEAWHIDGKKHNENGPALILYCKNGNIKKKRWYINDEELTEDEFNKIKK
jgi:hypothetical protein